MKPTPEQIEAERSIADDIVRGIVSTMDPHFKILSDRIATALATARMEERERCALRVENVRDMVEVGKLHGWRGTVRYDEGEILSMLDAEIAAIRALKQKEQSD